MPLGLLFTFSDKNITEDKEGLRMRGFLSPRNKRTAIGAYQKQKEVKTNMTNKSNCKNCDTKSTKKSSASVKRGASDCGSNCGKTK